MFRSGYSFAAYAALFLCFLMIAAGCRPARNSADPALAADNGAHATTVATGAQRADPGYIQYLERLSMLGSQTELARVVSGSQLAWLRSADAPFPGPLLEIADSWIAINPQTMLPETKRSVFATLSSPIYWQILGKSRIGGLYVAPSSGSGSLWAYNRKASVRGDDIIQYTFSEAAGQEEDYFRLLGAANSNHKLLGLELTPATTGLGPDFFLAARYHRQFSGIYCMVELPPKVWEQLPAVSDQWHGEPLSWQQMSLLACAQLLPEAMAQDFFPTGALGGWAVTGEIYGVDGLARRWAYRYYGSPDRPVVNWEDPSAGARRILSGSAIRNVGMLGGALVGMRMQGLYGLDAARPGSPSRFAASPADEAVTAVSREVRRYGGWSWLQDEIPLSLAADIMEEGPDFFQDVVFSPGVEHAVLTGSTALLDAMVDDALYLGLDMRRFVHATTGENGVSYSLPHLADVASGNKTSSVLSVADAETLLKTTQTHAQQVVYGSSLSSPRGEDKPPLDKKRLNTTTAGIAALALGKGNADSVTPEDETLARKGQFLQVFVRAMLPGLFMLSGQDMAGSLPLSWYAITDNSDEWNPELAARGAYALTQTVSDTAVTALGVPKAKTVNPPADVQILSEESFIARLAEVLAIRTTHNVANGTLHGRFITEVPGCFAFAVVLPQGKNNATAAPAPFPVASATGDETGALKKVDRKIPLAERRRLQHEANLQQRANLERRIVTTPLNVEAAPSGNAALIVAVNFSRDTVREVLKISNDPTLFAIRGKNDPQLLSTNQGWPKGEEETHMSFGPTTVTLTLPPWRAAVVHIGER